jgi:hypothetical protein
MRGAARSIILAAAALAVVAIAVRAQAKGDLFEERTAIATSTVANIEGRVGEIAAMSAQAQREGQEVKRSCIEDKLARAKINLTGAHQVMESWQLGASNPAFSQRSIDRLLLLQVYAMVYAEEARTCTDAQGVKAGIELKVEPNVPPSSDNPQKPPTGGPAPPIGGDDGIPWRPPRLERPPFASPF